jgi:prepilin-type N-terminal cleavage/methylation domain-containing protein
MTRSLQRSRHSTTKGFTVLELIVALTLGLVLLSAVWTMFRLFLRHEEVETAQMEKLQIVSSLHQHLSQELLNLFPAGNTGPDAPTPTPSKGNLPLPGSPTLGFPFPLPNQIGGIRADEFLPQPDQVQQPTLNLGASSLVGDSTRLELTVFASTDDFDAEEPTSNVKPNSSLDGQDKPPRSPSKTVTYEFVAPRDELDSQGNTTLNDDFAAAESEEDPQSNSTRIGLWRRESVASTAPNSQPSNNLGRNSVDFDFGQPAFNDSLSSPDTRRDEMESLNLQSNSQVEEFASEIIDLQFDYFDGRKWQSSWDSKKGNRLPVLVRVRFAVETRQSLRERKIEERSEKAFSRNPQINQDDDSASPLTQDSKRFGATEPLDPNWDYQFLLFIRPPARPAPSVSNQSAESRIKNSDRTNNRVKSTGGASR